ncbi:MAG: triose-phosphate isomerase [Flavobacteriales bacterium]|nr:triose-phosphate isomerase [Flavobacteriales bacterium]MDG2247051.1 triose-phosphate isomerase [Flavobacteriales bacterium]
MNRRIVAGNWKSNTTWSEATSLVEDLSNELEGKDLSNTMVIVSPPMVYLSALKSQLPQHIHLAAQNCSAHSEGAFTGEVTATMLSSAGVDFILAGHSERRSIFGETDEVVAQKVSKIISAGLRPILCVGESLEERDASRHFEVVKSQLEAAYFSNVKEGDATKVVIAYEPVWAIGTGRTASAEQAQEMHQEIRSWVRERFGSSAENVTILYGGSAKPGNANELFAGADVDGGLIGGASLKAADFTAIIEANNK